MAGSPNNRREAIADAALRVLAAEGSRALTHRAVDRELGIPEGSTSVYHRTRESLVTAAVTAALASNVELGESFPTTSTSRRAAAKHLAAMVERSLGPEHRYRQAARLELWSEAVRRPHVHDAFVSVKRDFIDRAAVMLEAAGCKDPQHSAPALVIYINALVMERLLYGEEFMSGDDLVDYFERFLKGC